MIRPPAQHPDTPRANVASTPVDLRVRAELLDIAARSGVLAGSISVCIALFTVILLVGAVDGRLLAGWASFVVVAAGAHAATGWFWQRQRQAEHAVAGPRIDPARIDRQERNERLAALACGIAWATLVLIVPDAERPILLTAFVLVIALVISGGCYPTSRYAHRLFVLPVVIAQTYNLMRLPVDYHGHLAVAWLGLVAVLYFMPSVSSMSLREGLIARIEHERKALEQAALLETAPLGILVVRDLRIVVCNDALLRMLGYDRKEELLGESIRRVIPDEETWRQAIANGFAAMRGPVPPSIVRRLCRDGSVIEIMCNVAAVQGREGDAPAYLGIYEDVRERLSIEEGYRHAIRMQRLVFESAGEGIVIVNDGVIEQANQAMSDLVGLPVAQLTDRPLHTLFEDRQGWLDIQGRFQRLGTLLKLERRIVRSDGRPIWVNVTGCLVDATNERVVDDPLSGLPAPKRSIWILADLTAQKQKEAENWHHANHDVMTGLPNRRFLQDRVDQALAFARRDGRRVAIVELDLDGFKFVNDTYGHHFGDAVLEEVARRLSTVVRELDTVGRWGGDEFVLVLKEIESREVVEETVKRVIARLSEPIVYMGQILSIGASIGIALFPDHGEEVEMLMLAADLAMYESKADGGNTWRFSSPSAEAPRGKYRPASTPAPIA